MWLFVVSDPIIHSKLEHPRLILAPFEMVPKRHLVTSTKSTLGGLQRYITSERPEPPVSPRWRGTMQSTTGKTFQTLVQLASSKAGYAPKLCSAWFVILLLLYGYSPRGGLPVSPSLPVSIRNGSQSKQFVRRASNWRSLVRP